MSIKKLTLGLSTLVLLVATINVRAQINVSSLGYSQNFDALGSAGAAWIDNSTLPGWYAANNVSGTVTPYTSYVNQKGSAATSGILYTFGATGSSEVALGGNSTLTAQSLPLSTPTLGLRLLNDTGSTFNSMTLAYDGEQWRNDTSSGNSLTTINVSYQIFAPGAGSLSVLTGWTPVPSLTFSTPVNQLPAGKGPIDGNGIGAIRGITATLSSLNVPSGSELWVEWTFNKVSGGNIGEAIDNVVVAVPEPATTALFGIGVFLLCKRLRSARR